MILFPLTLHRTYYNHGFFNVTVDFDNYVRSDEGPVTLMLGSDRQIEGYVNRTANLNGTARIMGGSELRDWFQANFQMMDQVDVDLSSFTAIKLSKP